MVSNQNVLKVLLNKKCGGSLKLPKYYKSNLENVELGDYFFK